MAMSKDFLTASVAEVNRTLPNPQEPGWLMKAQMLIALWFIAGLTAYAAIH